MAALPACSCVPTDHHRVGFGEKLPGHQDHKKISTNQKIAIVVATVFAALAAVGACAAGGLAVGGVVGVVIAASAGIGLAVGALAGFSVGVCLVALAIAGVALYVLKTAYTRNPLSTSDLEFPKDTPELGEFHEGHQIYVTKDAKETTEWKWDLIDQVEHSLEIDASIGGGPSFRRVLGKIRGLLERKPHVTVHLMTTDNLLEKEDCRLLKALLTTPNSPKGSLKASNSILIGTGEARFFFLVNFTSLDQNQVISGNYYRPIRRTLSCVKLSSLS